MVKRQKGWKRRWSSDYDAISTKDTESGIWVKENRNIRV